ncbi:MAG: hypothetical protein PHP32_05280 [Candidatus Izemoplasmatales bacterium]|nr:hypothetical protein [Candidatus Izemoplasmatales bacterium]
MTQDFQKTELVFEALAQSMGASDQDAKTALDSFLSAQGLPDEDQYIFEMAITQRGVTNVLYVRYAPVPSGTKGSSGIQIVKEPTRHYIHFTESLENFDQMTKGGAGDVINEYFKSHNLKMDMSKVFMLAKKREDGWVDIYIPYKEK